MQVDVIATASATALGLGQLVSGIFGMNLPASVFDADEVGDDTLFWSVAGATVLVVLDGPRSERRGDWPTGKRG